MKVFFTILVLTIFFYSVSSKANPTYPIEAALNNIEGHVILSFDITKEGRPDNIEIVESVPEGVFDSSAVAALSKWVYDPKLVDGKAVVQKDMKVQLDFKLDN